MSSPGSARVDSSFSHHAAAPAMGSPNPSTTSPVAEAVLDDPETGLLDEMLLDDLCKGGLG